MPPLTRGMFFVAYGYTFIKLEKKCQNEKLPILLHNFSLASILIFGDCGSVLVMYDVGMNIATLMKENCMIE
jgi:hypothetical protein